MLTRLDIFQFRLRLEATSGLGIVILASNHSYIIRKYRETKDGDFLFLESVTNSFSFLSSFYPQLFEHISLGVPFFLSYSPIEDIYQCYFLNYRKPRFKSFYFADKDLGVVLSLCNASFSKQKSISLERTYLKD